MWRNATRKPAKGTRHTMTATTPRDINNCFQGIERTTVRLRPKGGTALSKPLLSAQGAMDLN